MNVMLRIGVAAVAAWVVVMAVAPDVNPIVHGLLLVAVLRLALGLVQRWSCSVRRRRNDARPR